ncbi:hypothetical protein RMS99_004233 [Enterobacter hormaechei]|nr:hypothetical protein [Enterobacter hormaechei]
MATLQELIDLTPEQEKAWKRLEKAVKDFRAAGGKFYSVLDTLSAYNGEHVYCIDIGQARRRALLPRRR